MKKSLLSVIAMLVGCWTAGHAAIEVTTTNIEQPQGDTLLFALPVNLDCYQDIQNYYQAANGNLLRFMKFQPEYIVTAQDFTKGDTDKGTATLPNNAKVIGLGLEGYDNGSWSTSHGIFHEVTAWCRNIPREQTQFIPGYAGDGTDLLDGYNLRPPKGQLYTDTVNSRGYTNRPGYICTFDPEANEQNPGLIVDIPFNVPDEDGHFIPFWYQGENIYLTLWICNWYDVNMKYRYMAYDQAEGVMASLMRSGNYCFNSESFYDIPYVLGEPLPYDLPEHRLPAFRIPYYTNDLRITLEGMPAVLEVKDADGNSYPAAADGNFYSLDHSQHYTLYVDGKARYEFDFDNMYTDIDMVIKKDLTAVEEIGATKAVNSIVYYNLSGQQSAEPVEGVNIVVTTYSDGTRTTAKVIK